MRDLTAEFPFADFLDDSKFRLFGRSILPPLMV
jgi:hypothetical protein